MTITFPDTALVNENFPYLWKVKDISFCSLHIAEQHKFYRKCRLALDLSENAFSLFPTFFPSFTDNESNVVVSPLDLQISTFANPIVLPHFLDIAYRMAKNDVLLDQPLFYYMISAFQQSTIGR